MKKYWHVIGIGIQNNLTYRVNYLSRTLFSFIPLFAMLSLWRTIYAGKGQGSALGGYTQAQMIFYYLLVAVVDVLTAVNEDDWQIAADIREGNISQFLLKPIDYLWYRLCLFFSGRIAFISMACVPLAVFIFCFRDYSPTGQKNFDILLAAQALERIGDHAKNLAEELYGLSEGRSLRHNARKLSTA